VINIIIKVFWDMTSVLTNTLKDCGSFIFGARLSLKREPVLLGLLDPEGEGAVILPLSISCQSARHNTPEH
jgi:hypothetical protein